MYFLIQNKIKQYEKTKDIIIAGKIEGMKSIFWTSPILLPLEIIDSVVVFVCSEHEKLIERLFKIKD